MPVLQVVAETVNAATSHSTSPLEIFLQNGVLGAIVVVLGGAVLFLYRRTSTERDKYEALQEKRLEDQRMAVEKYHAVLADNARTLEKLAEAAERHAEALEELRRGGRGGIR